MVGQDEIIQAFFLFGILLRTSPYNKCSNSYKASVTLIPLLLHV